MVSRPADPIADDVATARTWIDVDLDSIVTNIGTLQARLPDETGILMTVKANAYGHGIVEVGRVAEEAGVWGLGVAALDEAAMLRAAGVQCPVVCLMPVLPTEARRVVSLDVTPAVTSLVQAEALDRAARSEGRRIPVHLDVDTGMGRTGVWDADASDLAKSVTQLQGLNLKGIFTHFASADERDRDHTESQLDRFDALLARLAAGGIEPPVVHVANSAAALRFGRAVRTLVRPGIALYGTPGEIAPDTDHDRWRNGEGGGPFRPALSWHARVVAVKDLSPGDSVSYHRYYVARARERVALLGVGYGDGWPFTLSNRGQVLLRGRPVAIRGSVCMDLTMVDATPFPDLAEGETATLVGVQGEARQPVEMVASEAGLISYAVLTGITDRVPRRYRRGNSTMEKP